MTNKDFSAELKELRNQKGLTQGELAELSGLSLRTIQRIEKGESEPFGDTKRKLIKILEAYPDAEFSNRKNLFTKYIKPEEEFGIKFKYLFISFAIFLIGLIFSLSIWNQMFSLLFLVMMILNVLMMVLKTAYHLWIKDYKIGAVIFMFLCFLFLLFSLSVLYFIPVKTVSERSLNGGKEIIRIEKNHFTGRSDTIIVNKKDGTIDVKVLMNKLKE